MAKVVETCKVQLSAQELRQMGDDLAQTIRQLVELENEKAASASAFAGSIKSTQTKAKVLAVTIGNGYELRPVECTVVYMMPRHGMKQIIRMDTSEIVREEPMNADELQADFGFGKGSKPQ
jgi:hypothetical protein